MSSKGLENSDREEFQVQRAIRRRWASVGRGMAFQAETPAEAARWRTALRRKLRDLMGLHTLQRTPLRPRVTESVDAGDHLRQRVEIWTEPDVVMPVFVLIPKAADGPFVPVMAPHGHCGGGKVAVAGVRGLDPDVDYAIGELNYAYGVELVRAGFIVFCPDARGFGERRERVPGARWVDNHCAWINKMAYPLGQTLTGMMVWDLQRLADYIETRPDCRPGPLGCAGLSGGGLQTLYTAALDERIRCAVVSGYFYGVMEALSDLENCSCNYIPHLYEYADMGDIGALIAPRPLLIETGDADPLNGASGLKNVRSQVRVTRKAYRTLGTPRNLVHDVFSGRHRWNGVKAVPFMVRHLQPGA